MKLTKEDKIKIIELHNLGYGSRRIAKQFSIETSTVKRLVAKYKIHGECVTEVKHTKRKFSVEYKLEVIQRIENGETENSIANELLLNHGLIHSWVKKYKELGYNGLIEKPKGRPKIMNPEENKKENNTEDEKDKKIAELERRNKQLQMENDLLKKLDALVQERIQRQSKKK